MPNLLALHVEQFDFEDQRGVRRYYAARATGTIAECGWDDESALTADLHRGNTIVPTGDDPLLSDGKLERLAAVERTVELLTLSAALIEPASVMHDANLTGLRRGPG